MNQNRLRIIKSKGREYVQEVNYKWDPISRRGRTEVVRHLGPLLPLTTDNYTEDELHKLKKITARKRKNTHVKTAKGELDKTNHADNRKMDLTPPEVLIKAVLRILQEEEKALTRNEAFDEYVTRYRVPVDDLNIVKTQVGFSLTILDREGKIRKSGGGFKGNPYRYVVEET